MLLLALFSKRDVNMAKYGNFTDSHKQHCLVRRWPNLIRSNWLRLTFFARFPPGMSAIISQKTNLTTESTWRDSRAKFLCARARRT